MFFEAGVAHSGGVAVGYGVAQDGIGGYFVPIDLWLVSVILSELGNCEAYDACVEEVANDRAGG